MRAYTITSTSGPRRKAWLGVLALSLAVCSLLVPSIASAQQSSVNAIMGAERTPGTAEFDSETSQPSTVQQVSPGYPSPSVESGASQTGATQQVSAGYPSPSVESVSQAGPSQNADSGYSSVSALAGPLPSEPTLVSGSPASTDDGFDWLSAAIGAAAAMALGALGGAAFLTVRRRTAVSPSTASMS